MSDPFGAIGGWLMGLLQGLGLEAGPARFILQFAAAGFLATILLLSTLFTIWAERKIIARMQDRLGPNRVGPFGMLQSVADLVKLVTKEVIIPAGADKLVYMIAPLLVVTSVVAIWAVVPLAPKLIGSDVNVSVLYIISVGSIGTLGIMLAGMSSNNKYALLGAFRTVAQMLSYAVPMILSLLVPTLLAGSMGTVAIVEQQRAVPFFLLAPLAAVIFFISSLTEVGRAPFDLAEAESELVAGFHIEYSGLSFGMFFVAEFLHAFTIGALTATLFLGGWQGPGVEQFPLLGLPYFLLKTLAVYFLLIWARATFPRVRIDQLNSLNWKFLTPLALAVLVVSAVTDKLASELGWNRILANLAGEGVIVVGALMGLWAYARSLRRRQERLRAQVMATRAAGAG